MTRSNLITGFSISTVEITTDGKDDCGGDGDGNALVISELLAKGDNSSDTTVLTETSGGSSTKSSVFGFNSIFGSVEDGGDGGDDKAIVVLITSAAAAAAVVVALPLTPVDNSDNCTAVVVVVV